MRVTRTKKGNIKMVFTMDQYEALEYFLGHINSYDFEEGTYDYVKALIVEKIYADLPAPYCF